MKKKLPLWILAITLITAPITISLLPGSGVLISVDVPESYSVGELVTLDASASKAETLIWQILPETKNFVVNGKIASFSSPKAIEYTVVISAINNDKLDSKIYYLKPKEPKIIKSLNNFEIRIRKWLPPGILESKEMGQSFKTISSLIEVETFSDIESLMLATVRANKDAVSNYSAWVPFFQELETYLETNPPKTLKDHAKIWREIGEALVKA